MLYIAKQLVDVHEFARLTHSQKASGFLFFQQKDTTGGIGFISKDSINTSGMYKMKKLAVLLQTTLGEMYFTKSFSNEADADRCAAVIGEIKKFYPIVPVNTLSVNTDNHTVSLVMSDEYQNYEITE